MIAFFLLAGLTVVSASQPTSTPLKTIVTVRSSAFCATFWNSAAPAAANVFADDVTIDRGSALFDRIFTDDVVTRSEVRYALDLVQMEYEVQAVVTQTSDAERLLSDNRAFPKSAKNKDDADLIALRDNLRHIIVQQKAALNVLSGYLATAQLGQLQTSSMDNPTWEAVFLAGGASSTSAGPSRRAAFGANGLFTAGLHHNQAEGRMPYENPRNAGLHFNPYSQFRNAIKAYRAQEVSDEEAVAKIFNDAVSQCSAQR